MRVLASILLVTVAACAEGAAEEPAPEAPASPAARAPALLGPRREAEREKALRANLGTARTEEAVDLGLDWLARHRTPGGGWDADGFAARCSPDGPKCDGIGKGQHGEAVPCPFDDAISALAALAFLGRGVIPGEEGSPRGALLAEVLATLEAPRDRWALALSTEAFADAEALEGKGRFRERVESGVRALLEIRQPDGAFGYCTPWRKGSDVPYTALVVSALVAARDAGVEVPADLGPGVDAFLSTLEEKEGKLAYLLDGRAFGYTPTTSNAHCALAIRALLRTGLGGSRHRAHRALVVSAPPVWKISFREVEVPGRGKVPVQFGNLSLYQWLYGTIGLFQEGGASWSGWFGKLKTALLDHQRNDGCARGSWNPDGTYERQTGGRVFATAAAVLMLEQPYRHRRLTR
ncbi:MAG: terpene cyclase/mutase family protein [Planctomycetes bacterium]|nr:terpene cyclase/mutase family protein [Planctomycetota bacterium]